LLARVTIKGLTKIYGKTIAVNDLNLDVADKSFAVLLGPSGCGKTTTLRCIAGLETLDKGEIYIGDRLVNDLAPKDRDVAMVFQSYALYPHMTVFDNLAFPLKIRKLPNEEIKRRVHETAQLLRITHLLDRKPKQLSGGEAQRTALGRAIIRNPKVFLMDEPLSNLDAKLRLYMRAELKKLQREIGVTTIYVTHDQVEAMAMADKVAIMNNGVLEQFGNASEIFEHPASTFVAGFIGSPPMNFINCTFLEKNGSPYLEAEAFTLAIPDNIGELIKKNATDSDLVLGVRPEDITLTKNWTNRNVIKVQVYVLEPLGSETIVDIKVGDELLKVKTASDFAASPGDAIGMSINMEKIHIFDKKTGKAIIV
jgi:multiple sugar transport system ATP-binding protein